MNDILDPVKLSDHEFQSSDLGLVNSSGIFGALIRPVESWKYGTTDATHTFCFMGGLIRPPSVVEQLWFMSVSPVTKYDPEQVKVWRNKKWTDLQKNQIAAKMLTLSNEPYPILKLPLNFLDCLASSILKRPCFWFTQKFSITSFTECAQAYAWACYQVIGTDDIFGCGWRSIDPEGQDQWCENHPEDWELVFK